MDNKPFKSHGYGKLKKICSNCHFRKDGKAIALSPGRLEGIIQDLVDNETSSFYCSNGGERDDEGNYHPSGEESILLVLWGIYIRLADLRLECDGRWRSNTFLSKMLITCPPWLLMPRK